MHYTSIIWNKCMCHRWPSCRLPVVWSSLSLTPTMPSLIPRLPSHLMVVWEQDSTMPFISSLVIQSNFCQYMHMPVCTYHPQLSSRSFQSVLCASQQRWPAATHYEVVGEQRMTPVQGREIICQPLQPILYALIRLKALFGCQGYLSNCHEWHIRSYREDSRHVLITVVTCDVFVATPVGLHQNLEPVTLQWVIAYCHRSMTNLINSKQ